MPRRVTKARPSLFTPAGSFVKRLARENPTARRKAVIVGFWLIAGFFAWSLVIGDYGVPRIIRLELEKRGMEEANRRQLTQLIDATQQRQLLQSDSTYIEYIARTKYHMARPNETIYRYRSQ
jgi:cell division protein FtsB